MEDRLVLPAPVVNGRSPLLSEIFVIDFNWFMRLCCKTVPSFNDLVACYGW